MSLPEPLAAREKRTFGVFLLMLGAGLLLDHGSMWLGTICLLFGTAFFVIGMLAWRRPNSTPDLQMTSEPGS